MKAFIFITALVLSANVWAETGQPNCRSDNVMDGGYVFVFKQDGTISIDGDSISGARDITNKKINISPDGKPGLCKLKVSFNPEDPNNSLDLRINLSAKTARAYSATVNGKALNPHYLSLFCLNTDSLQEKFPECTSSVDPHSNGTSGGAH